MNLIQINERLKDLPMQVLQQYANGMNPEVPPYLALGELQRRESSQKQMATAQGGAQGAQPSIKEQVEQKAGLMALQQMQQQQVAQQMQQPRGPMPAPSGTPQPEAQPQAMMARGGLAAVPMRRGMFEYAGGGIIAFAEGGAGSKYETRYDRMNRKNREEAEANKPRVINAPPGTSDQEIELIRLQNPDADVRTGEEGAKLEKLKSILSNAAGSVANAATYSSDVEAMKNRERIAASPSGSVSEAQASAMAGPQAQVPEGLPAALQQAGPAAPKPSMPPAQGAAPSGAPRPQPTGLPGAMPQAPVQNKSPLMDEALTMARQKPAAPTPESVIEEQNKLLPPGMREEAMKKRFDDQRARADGRQAAYEKSKPSGLDDLIRVFGQAGQYKGLSGTGPAYTAMQQQRRAEDLAMQKQQDELMTAIEDREVASDKELFGSRERSMTAANKSYQERLVSNTKALADLAGVDQRRMDEAASRLTQMQIAKLREATANKPTEAERIEAKYVSLKATKGDAAADEYLSTIQKIKGSGTAGVGAGRNRIMERRQSMAELKDVMKDEGMNYSEEEKKQAASEYRRLAILNLKDGEDGGGGGNAPKIGTVQQGYRFKGGNPADQSNWEKVK